MKRVIALAFGLLTSATVMASNPMFTTDIAISGRNIVLSNKGTKSVTIIDNKGAKIRDITLDNPATGVCIVGNTIYATSSYATGYLHAIDIASGSKRYTTQTGMGARAPFVSADGSKIYVCNQFKNSVSEVDAATGTVLREAEVLREPVDAVVTPDGKYMFVNNFLPAQRADIDYVSADVSVIDMSTFKTIKNIKLSNGSNALRGICVSPDGRYVFVSHNLGRFQVPTSQLQQGWMNTSAVSVIDVPKLEFAGSLLMDEPDRGAAGIWGVAATSNELFVSQSGTHDISIVELGKLREKLEKYGNRENLSYDLKFVYDIRKRLPLVGNGPRSVVVSEGKLYVPTYFSDTLNIVDIATHNVEAVAYNPTREESLEDRGERAFNDANNCYQNWQSCNGCHPGDGRTDGMNWDLMNDGVGNPKNCKSMLYSHVTAPNMISGIRANAEIAVRAGYKHIQFCDVPEDIAVATDAYMKALRPLPSPFLIEGKLSPKAEKGKKVYEKLHCDVCHNGQYYTDFKMHRIGDDVEFEAGWDTPTLIEVWRTAPYLFDGRAATMKEVFSVFKHGIESKVSDREIDELVEYVNSL